MSDSRPTTRRSHWPDALLGLAGLVLTQLLPEPGNRRLHAGHRLSEHVGQQHRYRHYDATHRNIGYSGKRGRRCSRLPGVVLNLVGILVVTLVGTLLVRWGVFH